MTQSDPPLPRPTASVLVSPSPVTPRTSAAARAGIRYGMSLVAVLLGAYLLIDGSWDSFVSVLLTHDAGLGFLIVTQLLFGVVVLLFGVLVAPVEPARRVIAAVVVVVLILLFAVLQPAYATGAIGIPVRGFLLSTLIGAPSLVTLAAATAWLIVRRRPGLSYLLLIAIVLIPIVVNGLVLAAVPSAMTTIVSNVLAAVIGIGIAWAARAIAGGRSQPIG